MKTLDSIRRALGTLGFTAPVLVPEASGGRTLAFLDWVQRSEIVAYSGAASVVVADRRLNSLSSDMA